MRDCKSPNLNSANINFWPLGGHFAKNNSRQIFCLYGMPVPSCMGLMFLVVVDAHTKWLKVIPMATTSGEKAGL